MCSITGDVRLVAINSPFKDTFIYNITQVSETSESTFDLTPLAQCLCTGAMRPLALMFLSDWHDKAWSELVYSVRTGKPGFDHAFGKSAFEWMEENPEARHILDQGQGLKARGFAQAVIESCDFSDFSSICDIGGGRERTVDEFKDLLNSAGLAVSKVIPTNQGVAVLECVTAKFQT